MTQVVFLAAKLQKPLLLEGLQAVANAIGRFSCTGGRYPPLLLSLYELGDVLRQGSGEERVSLVLHNQIILLFDYAYDETPLADQWPPLQLVG